MCWIRMMLAYGVNPTDIYILSPENVAIDYTIVIPPMYCYGYSPNEKHIHILRTNLANHLNTLFQTENHIMFVYIGHSTEKGIPECNQTMIPFIDILVQRLTNPKFDKYQHCLLINSCFSNLFIKHIQKRVILSRALGNHIAQLTPEQLMHSYLHHYLTTMSTSQIDTLVVDTIDVDIIGDTTDTDIIDASQRDKIKYLLTHKSKWAYNYRKSIPEMASYLFQYYINMKPIPERLQAYYYKFPEREKLPNVAILTSVNPISSAIMYESTMVMFKYLQKTLDYYRNNAKDPTIMQLFHRTVKSFSNDLENANTRHQHVCCGIFVSPYNRTRISTFFPNFVINRIPSDAEPSADPHDFGILRKGYATIPHPSTRITQELLQQRAFTRKQLLAERRKRK